MARLDAKWGNFWQRGQTWYHFWQDTEDAGGLSSISGTSDGSCTVTGSLIGSGGLSGSSAGSVTISGFLQGIGQLSGAVSGNVTVTGLISGSGSLAGVINGTSDVTGNLVNITPVSGSGGGFVKPRKRGAFKPAERNFELQRENDKRIMKIFEAFLKEV